MGQRIKPTFPRILHIRKLLQFLTVSETSGIPKHVNLEPKTAPQCNRADMSNDYDDMWQQAAGTLRAAADFNPREAS